MRSLSTHAALALLLLAAPTARVLAADNVTVAFEPEDVRPHLADLGDLGNCPCVRAYLAKHERAATAKPGGLRLYLIDQENTANSGLHHQMSNLASLLTEAFSLGRAAVLGPPSLDRIRHNFGRKLRYDRWGSWFSLNASSFMLREGKELICNGFLAQCLVDGTTRQREALRAAADEAIDYEETLAEIRNERAAVLWRGPTANTSRANLLKKLPGVKTAMGSSNSS